MENEKTLCITGLVHDSLHDTYSIVLNSEKCLLLPYRDFPRGNDLIRAKGKTWFICNIDMEPVFELVCFDYNIAPEPTKKR